MVTIKPLIPRIDWKHPLTKGLVFDAPLFERGGTTTMDMVSRVKGTLSGSPTWNTGLYGSQLKFAPASANVVGFTSVANQNSLNALSVECLIYLNGVGEVNNGRFFSKGTAATRFGISYTNTTSDPSTNNNSLIFSILRASVTSSWCTPIDSFTIGKLYHVVVTQSSLTTFPNPVIYINGVAQVITVASAGSGLVNADTAGIYLGSNATTIRDFDGNIIHSRMWNRALNAQEAKALFTNPYRIYRDYRR